MSIFLTKTNIIFKLTFSKSGRESFSNSSIYTSYCPTSGLFTLTLLSEFLFFLKKKNYFKLLLFIIFNYLFRAKIALSPSNVTISKPTLLLLFLTSSVKKPKHSIPWDLKWSYTLLTNVVFPTPTWILRLICVINSN